jgi:hypothetical protein
MEGVCFLQLPAQSPELNPIKKLWGLLKDHVASLHPSSLKDLSTAINNFWRGLSVAVVNQYIDHHQCEGHHQGLGASYQGIKTTLTKVILMPPHQHDPMWGETSPNLNTGILLMGLISPQTFLNIKRSCINGKVLLIQNLALEKVSR